MSCAKSSGSYHQFCESSYNNSGYDRVAKLAPSASKAPANAFSGPHPKVFLKAAYGSAGYRAASEACGSDSGNYLSMGDAYGQ